MTDRIVRAASVVLVASMVAWQGVAFGLQFVHGFRPFVAAPVRVPGSWDMFAPRIERCVVRFVPPLTVRGRAAPSMQSLVPGLEWDAVLDRVQDYELAARYALETHGELGGRADLDCFHPDGRSSRHALVRR